ncbi:hypothetical protein [Bradyrhizobium icense]|uniref:Uncharacterized protein n=1 Tax=Bradyrhizobium icense TaxID=1274631 RepID=A0A1B1UK52_9BRAD|nr:hypothetical protein [Bradyrhizobium icense]ANW03161.1 hypothetical protein LMTR13_26495 [Bradyrhizobium icense]
MSVTIDSKLAERLKAKRDELDKKAIDAITSGNLTDWGRYQREGVPKGARRRARCSLRRWNILKE